MKTILIPVDFSKTSENALKYAIALTKDIEVKRIILLKSFYKSIYEQLLPSADFVQLSADDIQEERNNIDAQLQMLTNTLLKECNRSIKIQTAISELPIVRAILHVIEDEHPDLLIVGSDQPEKQDESDIGQQIITIAKISPVPVLIVPSGIRYQRIEQVLIPCDFATVSRLSLIKDKPNLLDLLHPELMILNIDPKQKHLSHEQEHLDALKERLVGYVYKTYYTEDRNTVQGILNFARIHHVQLITALPGRYSFFYNLTHTSITEAITQNAQDPVLILK